MTKFRPTYGKLIPEEAAKSRSIYLDKQLSRVDYSMEDLSSISFVTGTTTRDVSICVISTDVAGDISVFQSIDGVNYSEVVGSGLPLAASAIGGLDSDIINISGVAGNFFKIVYDKTSEGSDPYVSVLCVGTGV